MTAVIHRIVAHTSTTSSPSTVARLAMISLIVQCKISDVAGTLEGKKGNRARAPNVAAANAARPLSCAACCFVACCVSPCCFAAPDCLRVCLLHNGPNGTSGFFIQLVVGTTPQFRRHCTAKMVSVVLLLTDNMILHGCTPVFSRVLSVGRPQTLPFAKTWGEKKMDYHHNERLKTEEQNPACLSPSYISLSFSLSLIISLILSFSFFVSHPLFLISLSRRRAVAMTVQSQVSCWLLGCIASPLIS